MTPRPRFVELPPLPRAGGDRLVAGKAPDFEWINDRPLNGGPTEASLGERLETPTSHFFVRNHGPIPRITPSSYRLRVDGGERGLSLKLDELRALFPAVEATATLQCAGNRRREMMRWGAIENEIPWAANGIGTARWSGVRLRDVLRAAGIPPDAHHVAFTGTDVIEKKADRVIHFGGSIPLRVALDPDIEVLLAHQMNGEPLPLVHGWPLRVLAPGIIGARSVKWVWRIELRAEPSENFFQQRAYKVFPPDVTATGVDWSSGRMLEDTVLNAFITAPREDERVAAGIVTVAGWAVPGRGARIARVEVSADGGATWRDAVLATDPRPGVWTLWRTEVPVAVGAVEIVARATDSAGNTQGGDPARSWNFKGYAYNAPPHARIEVVGR